MSAPSSPDARPVAGVFLGLLIEIGGTLLTAGAVSIAYMYVLARQGTRHRDLVAAFTSPAPDSAFFIICMSILATFCFFGSLVCQRMTRSAHLGYTAFMALACIATGVALTATLYSWNLWLIMAAVVICCLFLGGRVAGRRG